MYFVIRRAIDTVLALIMVMGLLPILLFIALWIRLDSKGSVLFKQKRMGKCGVPFEMYKFRTMVENAQNMGTGVFSFAGDPRVTKSGAILRKTSLDELPQLINIIKGEMAFVGPRAPVIGCFPDYDDLKDEYRKRFTVLPGITGLAQCVGRNDFTWVEKIHYDNIYVDNVNKYGFLYDCKIWIMTIFRVMSMKSVDESIDNMERSKQALKEMKKKG